MTLGEFICDYFNILTIQDDYDLYKIIKNYYKLQNLSDDQINNIYLLCAANINEDVKVIKNKRETLIIIKNGDVNNYLSFEA